MNGKFWFRVVSYIIVLLSGIFFLSVVARNIASLPSFRIDLLTSSYIVLLIILYVALIAIAGTVWHIILRAIGEPAQYRDAVMIFAVSQFARYIPGNIAHQVGRVALAKTYGMGMSRVIFSMIVEAGWAIAASAFLTAVSVLTLTDRISLNLPNYLTSRNLIILAIGAGLIPFIIGYIIRNTPRLFRWILDERVKRPNILALALCFGFNVIIFLLMGLILDSIAIRLFNLRGGGLLFATAVFSAAWIAGFLTPGAPAGLGIREAIIIAGLSPVYGAGNTIAITVVLRIVTMMGDCLAFGIGLMMRRLSPPSLAAQQLSN